MMALGDVLVERELTNREALDAVAELFSLRRDEVLLINDLEELLAPHVPDRRVLVHKWRMTGGFRTVLSFHEGEFINRPALEVATKLCRVLQCRCLISDDSVNPFTMILVDPNGNLFIAHLDADKLSENDEYEVRSVSPLPPYQ